ncbi:hypothetical protein D7V64_09605 [Acinetobacter cumulans]|uniref:Uncharacterized protein n=1 Tax=Acinetobacter cumulans TaxID=2136182 RepID=A0A3A8GAX9_9GAMM|nr:hypothetical protein D7V64_09605 [Acinetobacter cumulans]
MHAVSSVVIKRDLYKLNSVGIVKSKPVGWQRALFGNCEILTFPLLLGDEKHCFARGEVSFINYPHPNLLPEPYMAQEKEL